MITKRADGIRDGTADSCADGPADGSDGLGLRLAGANAQRRRNRKCSEYRLGLCSAVYSSKWVGAAAIDEFSIGGEVFSDDREDRRMGIVIVGRNPIGDHLMGVG